MIEERERTAELARSHEERMAREDPDGRRRRGAFYTPSELVEWILDRALAPGVRRVLDPACGTGHFLVAAARRLGDVRAVHGSDTDAEAVRIARLRLAAEDPSVPAAEIAARVRVADGLTVWTGAEPFDAVVGNPPFLGQLRRRTARPRDAAGRRRELGAYTDTSAVFLHRALGLVRSGGVVALVQPLSVLAARDAGPVRAAVAECGAVVDLRADVEPQFAGTGVRTCVPVVRIGGSGGPDPDHWGRLAAPAFGIPTVDVGSGAGFVGDLARCTADFRDQYYGLVPHVRDAADGLRAGEAPLVTSGLIDPVTCRWGSRATRFARTGYAAPAVDVDALTGALGDWARGRLRPKLLVAGQGRVIEAVVDEAGAWLPSVPVVSVLPRDPADLWRLLAVLLAPPVVADAAARYLGTGLAPGSVKVSARQLSALPLPGGVAEWARGAALVERAQRSGDRAVLVAAGEAMTAAYGLVPSDPSVAWWTGRIGSPGSTPSCR